MNAGDQPPPLLPRRTEAPTHDADVDEVDDRVTHYPRRSAVVGPSPDPSSKLSVGVPFQPKADVLPPPPSRNRVAPAERTRFIETGIPSRVKTALMQDFGKDNLHQCFYAEPAFRHVLLPLHKSGFLSPADVSNLCAASRHSRVLVDLLLEYSNVDFRPLQGYPEDVQSETELNQDRIKWATAALLHFDGDVAAVVRWVGGPHTGEHRNHEERLRRLQPILPPALFEDLRRLYMDGMPARCNASATEANFQAARQYGNHKSLDMDPAMLSKKLLKNFKDGYILGFDLRVVDFMLNCHLSPQGIAKVFTEKARLVFDGSFRPHPSSFAINDWVDIRASEPEITFQFVFMEFLTWIYNLRITYPDEDILVGDDDIARAFRHMKHHPNLAGMMCFVAQDVLWSATGGTFGANFSPPNFEVIRRSTRCASQHFWKQGAATVEEMCPSLPPVQLAPPATAEEVAKFTRADPDSKNTGVMDSNGERRPPPFGRWVDDGMYADVARFMELALASSAKGVYEVLGYPDSRVPDPLSREKLRAVYTFLRDLLGWRINTRDLSVSLTPLRRDEIVALLRWWLSDPQRRFTLLQMAELHGKLEHISRFTTWGRVWFYALQNLMREVIRQRTFVVLRMARRAGIADKFAQELEPSLLKRLEPLMAKWMARILWNDRTGITMPKAVWSCLQALHDYLANPRLPWKQQIGFIIDRDPHVISYGDAATTKGGGGAHCASLKFWFDVVWSAELSLAIRSGKVDINCLEFVVVLLQLVGILERMRTLSPLERATFFPNGVPAELVVLIWCDNVSAMQWAATLGSKSLAGQRLLGFLAELLRQHPVGLNSKYISTEENVLADFISRLSPTDLSHSQRVAQMSQSTNFDRSWSYFRPSPEILSVVHSLLLSKQAKGLPSLPKNFGQFVPDALIFSCSAEI